MAEPKKWLQDRWVLLDAALENLTLEREGEVQRLCEVEIDYFRNERNLQLGPLGNMVSQTRRHLLAHFKDVLTENNAWLNPRTAKREHISTKYMNLSKEEWAERTVPSKELKEARLQDRKSISDPDAVVAKAVSLLTSSYWQDVTVALACLTGRRLHEVLAVGSFTPHTRYSVMFTGQLKTQERVMKPYEVPVLCEATTVLSAVDHLRDLIGKTVVNEDSLGGVADHHFSELVPPREDSNLYTHLFRAVYGCIAVFYFCPEEVQDTVFLNRVYGHYWMVEASGKLKADYESTSHYQDYIIGNAAIMAHSGQRQGVKLGEPGVEVLVIFQQKPETQPKKGSRKVVDITSMTKEPSKTGYSMIKPKEGTMALIRQFIVEEDITDSSPYDAALVLLLNRNYELKTLQGYGSLEEITALLAEAAGNNQNPVVVLAELLKLKASLDKILVMGVNLESVAALLADASPDASKVKDKPNVVDFLARLLKDKRDFKAGYDARVHGKDYASMKTSELKAHKAPEATTERYNRAVLYIMLYNEPYLKSMHEACWYISPKAMIDLVGGSPSTASDYLKARPDVEEYHKANNLTPGMNRKSVPITERVKVPELPVVVGAVESEVPSEA